MLVGYQQGAMTFDNSLQAQGSTIRHIRMGHYEPYSYNL